MCVQIYLRMIRPNTVGSGGSVIGTSGCNEIKTREFIINTLLLPDVKQPQKEYFRTRTQNHTDVKWGQIKILIIISCRTRAAVFLENWF